MKTTVTQHSHKYTQFIKGATCASEGYTEYRCDCGSSYKDEYTPATHEHNFRRSQKKVGDITYDTTICANCGTEVFAQGNADGSYAGGNDKVKFYVTGKVSAGKYGIHKSDYHIVIYGQGAMSDLERNGQPMWYDYLSEATEITIAEGVTTICSNAFNCPNGRTQITFNMADSVNIIKANAINLNMKSITLGKGVERIEDTIKGKNMTEIYLPRKLKFFGGFGSSWNADTTIFYEGTKEDFLNITTRSYNQAVTVKSLLDKYYSGDVYTPYCNVYLECDNIFDESNYFDTMREWQ